MSRFLYGLADKAGRGKVHLPVMSLITIGADSEHRASGSELKKLNLRRRAREDMGNLAQSGL